MIHYDATQTVLEQYLQNTEVLLNELLSSKFAGTAKIRVASDLGFPHDVIRIAGGFATGAYVSWHAERPFVPVDTCVNVCSASYFELEDDIQHLFTDEHLNTVKSHLSNGIYISNFHRGNHFISFLESCITGKRYLLLHSSANEYKENFNGLYPVENNWFFDRIKTFSNGKTYVRYLDDNNAELFYTMAQGLYKFNEIRHEFIADVILNGATKVNEVSHYHHYGMPTHESIVMGSHILHNGDMAPILTLPGENIYMIKFDSAKDKTLQINDEQFLTPHGWGKRHLGTPKMSLDFQKNKFSLDDDVYDIQFGTSLRAHQNLELRDFQDTYHSRKHNFFKHLEKMYNFEIVDDMKQIASWNKAGVKVW